jgi:hypothetical protein
MQPRQWWRLSSVEFLTGSFLTCFKATKVYTKKIDFNDKSMTNYIYLCENFISKMDKMLASSIEVNRKEYDSLLKDDSYTDVRFNPKNGGLLAIHKEHHFDTTIGKFGIPRGDYEKIAIEVLYDYGRSVVLWSERTGIGISMPEGLLDWKKFDIKGIEGTGKRNIVDKISAAGSQGAETIVLYYHDAGLFDLQKIINAYNGYLKLSKTKRIQTVYYIIDNKLHKIDS